MAPFGILAPNSKYCWGFFKKLTNSIISILASSQPATSLKVTLMSLAFTIFAVEFPKPNMPPGPPRPPRPPGPRKFKNSSHLATLQYAKYIYVPPPMPPLAILDMPLKDQNKKPNSKMVGKAPIILLASISDL